MKIKEMEKKMKETYYLNKETLPKIPAPHDFVIKRISVKDRCIVFEFEDDISYHDSIQYLKPEAKSLIVTYHLAYDADDYAIFKERSRGLFRKRVYYQQLDNSAITGLTGGKFKLTYLYHNVDYCSIITKLFSGGYIILDADVDYVEYEWIC